MSYYDLQPLVTSQTSIQPNGMPAQNIVPFGSTGHVWAGAAVSPAIGVLNVTNTGGLLKHASLRILTELYPCYDNGPGQNGARNISIWLNVNLDGQGGLNFIFVDNSASTGSGNPVVLATRCQWAMQLNALFTPGILVSDHTIYPVPQQGSSFSLQLNLEFITSCVINMFWSVAGFTGGSATAFNCACMNSSNYQLLTNSIFEMDVYWAKES